VHVPFPGGNAYVILYTRACVLLAFRFTQCLYDLGGAQEPYCSRQLYEKQACKDAGLYVYVQCIHVLEIGVVVDSVAVYIVSVLNHHWSNIDALVSLRPTRFAISDVSRTRRADTRRVGSTCLCPGLKPRRLYILCWRELSRRRLLPVVSPAAGHLTTPTIIIIIIIEIVHKVHK